MEHCRLLAEHVIVGLGHQSPFSLPSQEPGHDQKDFHKHEGAVEAAECQQRLCQAEETHPYSPSRQEAEQKRNASLGNEVYQLFGQGPGRAKPTANRSSCSGKHSGALSPRAPPARHGWKTSTQRLWSCFPWPQLWGSLGWLWLSVPGAVLVEEFCGCVCAVDRCDRGSNGDRSWEQQRDLRNVALASSPQDFRQKDLLRKSAWDDCKTAKQPLSLKLPPRSWLQ